jgi:hypothetical protein
MGLTEDQLLGKTSFDKDWLVIHEDGSTFTPEDHCPSSPQTNKNNQQLI